MSFPVIRPSFNAGKQIFTGGRTRARACVCVSAHAGRACSTPQRRLRSGCAAAQPEGGAAACRDERAARAGSGRPSEGRGTRRCGSAATSARVARCVSVNETTAYDGITQIRVIIPKGTSCGGVRRRFVYSRPFWAEDKTDWNSGTAAVCGVAHQRQLAARKRRRCRFWGGCGPRCAERDVPQSIGPKFCRPPSSSSLPPRWRTLAVTATLSPCSSRRQCDSRRCARSLPHWPAARSTATREEWEPTVVFSSGCVVRGPGSACSVLVIGMCFSDGAAFLRLIVRSLGVPQDLGGAPSARACGLLARCRARGCTFAPEWERPKVEQGYSAVSNVIVCMPSAIALKGY